MDLDGENLVGLWSVGAGYYDTFSDEWLIFRPDGTGRLVYLTPFNDSSHHFRWRVASRGVIDLIGHASSKEEADTRGSGEFHFLAVRYSMCEGERPPGTGNRMLVLRLDLVRPWPRELGFVTKDYTAAEARLTNK